MTIGVLLVIIGAFILVIGAKGTYQYLPPWYLGTPAEKKNNTPVDTASLVNSISHTVPGNIR